MSITALNQQNQFPAATTTVDPVFYNTVQSLVTQANALVPGSSIAPNSVTSNQINNDVIQILQFPLTLANIQTTHSVPINVLGAQGAGTLIQVMDWTFDLIHGSAAFVSGGAVGLYLGTDATGVLVSTAVAATFFTTFTASHIIYNPGSIMAVAASTTVLNTGLVLANPSADFTSGTGGSGIVTITYRIISGLS